MRKQAQGELIIIGGHEDKKGEKVILREVAERAKKGNSRLALVTVATREDPNETVAEYTKIFTNLGVEHVDPLNVLSRREAYDDEQVETIKKSCVVFFTGGDQLRIT